LYPVFNGPTVPIIAPIGVFDDFRAVAFGAYNPVRAKMALKPEDYPWSSYGRRVLGIEKEDDRLLDELIL